MVLKLRKSVTAVLTAVFLAACALLIHNGAEATRTGLYAMSFGRDQSGPLLISLFQNNVQDAAQLFYADYYSAVPIVDPWDISVVGIKKQEDSFTVTFAAKPYLGPHDYIGRDEIEFAVLKYGTAALIDYRHIENYELPENLKSLQKKAFEE